jgi:hypothetical protein
MRALKCWTSFRRRSFSRNFRVEPSIHSTGRPCLNQYKSRAESVRSSGYCGSLGSSFQVLTAYSEELHHDRQRSQAAKRSVRLAFPGVHRITFTSESIKSGPNWCAICLPSQSLVSPMPLRNFWKACSRSAAVAHRTEGVPTPGDGRACDGALIDGAPRFGWVSLLLCVEVRALMRYRGAGARTTPHEQFRICSY